jgi:HEAT repeat protein
MLCAVSLLLARVTATAQEKEPTYEGKTVSQWVERLKNRQDYYVFQRVAAAEALRKMGAAAKAAVPALADALRDRERDVQLAAAEALAKMGAEAQQAVPALCELLTNGDTRLGSAAADALGKMGAAAKAAAPALQTVLKDPDQKRYAAAEALARIGAGAPPPAILLVPDLRAADPNLRRRVPLALGKLGWAAVPAVPALIEALKDKNLLVRRGAANALGLIGPEAKAAVPALCAALKDDARMRIDAAVALLGIGEQKPEALAVVNDLGLAKPALPAQLALARAVETEERYSGFFAALAAADRSNPDHFVKGLDPAFRWAAVSIRAELHADAVTHLKGRQKDEAKAAAVAFLLEVLKDKDDDVRRAAAEGLKKIDPDAAKKAGVP